jgi:pimeloyl-ACP methyl ester carboxylesterase
MRSFWHERAGIRLSVAEIGEGRPLVFQHGLCGDAGQAADVFPGDRGWRCLTLECRGHGKSEVGPFEDLSIATFAGDVASLIEAQALGPVVVGGISMGAAIALRLAAVRPELVRAIVLGRPAWIDQGAPPNLGANALVGRLLSRFPPEEARTRFEASETARLVAVESPDNLASLRGMFSRQPASTTRELLCRISAGGPEITRDQIRAIRVPALIISTARDFVHPLAMAHELAALIPDAKMAQITPKSDSPELYRNEFKAALSSFLDGLDA